MPFRTLTLALGAWSWVPIRSLAPRHRPRILAHLLALDVHDRYLRFGYPATDEQIVRYVDSLDFTRDELFGIFNRRLQLIAMAHVAYAVDADEAAECARAEFGVSVLARARGRGYGGRLFEHAVLHARNRGVDTLFIHALTENTPMLKIARRAGATVERSGCETEAWLRLPPETLLTRFGEIMETQAAEFDYQLKQQAHRVNALLESLAEVRTHLSDRAVPTARE
ncbi:MAG TPA: GNAT family N-acetyltransferase [Albitalea sp.]